MYKKITNRQGMTPLGFIILITLIGLIVVLGINRFMPDAEERVLDMRAQGLHLLTKRTVRQMDQIIKYSENIQMLPRPFVANMDRMDSNCSYLMVSPDGKRIVIMKHDGSKFVEKGVIARERRNVKYEIFFEKGSMSEINNVNKVKYEINVYIIDPKENTPERKIVLESSMEPVSGTTVIDKGTGISERDFLGASPAVALSYNSNE